MIPLALIPRWVDWRATCQISCDISMGKEEYWQGIHVHARTDYRKAVKSGVSFKQVIQVPHTNIVEIFNSCDSKNNRPINKRYEDFNLVQHSLEHKWPYDEYPEDNNLIMMMGAYIDNELRAYIEIVSHKENTIVHSVMGHKKYFPTGIMKFLFIETIYKCIDIGSKRFYYGTDEFLHDKRKYFVRDLNIQ